MKEIEKYAPPREVAAAFKASGLFPDLRSEAEAYVKVVAGAEMGIGPMAAMTGINVIQGKPTLSANLLAAQVKRHPRYDYRVLEHSGTICKIEFRENGEAIGVSEFTIADAQRAGVAGGQNWKKYPAAMLFARALTQGVRWYAPDVTSGPAYTPEEVGGSEVRQDEPPTAEPETVTATIVTEGGTPVRPIDVLAEELGPLSLGDDERAAVRDHVAPNGIVDEDLVAEAIDWIRENGNVNPFLVAAGDPVNSE